MNGGEVIELKSLGSFLLENVAALTSRGHQIVCEEMIQTRKASGKYFVTWRVLNAMHFGIPQNRPRVLIVGLLRSAGRPAGFGWPKTHRRRPPLPLTRFLCGGAGVLRKPPAVGTGAHEMLKRGLRAIREEGGNPRTPDYSLDR